MIIIPIEHLDLIPNIIEWHLSAYGRDTYDSMECAIRLERILENWYRCHKQAETGTQPFAIEDKELYFLRIAAKDAQEYIEECNLCKNKVDIFVACLDRAYQQYRNN